MSTILSMEELLSDLRAEIARLKRRRTKVTSKNAGSYVGEIRIYAGAVIPDGWIACRGQSLLKTAYPVLANVIGNAYGGSGTSFLLPDLRARVVVGAQVTGTSMLLGQQAGSSTHTHFEGDLRAAIGASGSNAAVLSYQAGTVSPRGPSNVTQYTVTGAGSLSDLRAFNHHTRVYGETASSTSYPPYAAINYMIRAE
jgi:microcystin-dependent protein